MTQKDQTDYTSKVPHFAFSMIPDEQEQQLAANPLLERFRVSRKSLSADPYRPHYHFVSPESTLNDPNGLCFWQNRWHLFYQGYPPEDSRQHWGHAVSDDLLHWRDLPYAIYPNPERCCFSGATLVESDRVIAMYHGTEVGNMVALSNDPLLLNWSKLTDQPVIPMPTSDPAPYRVFDPCVWNKEGVYYALSGGTLPHGPSGRFTRANFLFRSDDLETWDYLHPFVEGDLFSMVGDDGACPYFWPIGDRHILLHFSHMSGGRYLLGDYDTERDKFVVTSGGTFTFGPFRPGGVHAPSATPDGQGGLIVLFNVNMGKPTPGWDQIMSLPRRLTLIGKDELGMEPAGDIASLRGQRAQVPAQKLEANREIVLDGIGGSTLEIEAEIDVQGAQMLELNVLRSPGSEEYTRIVFYKQRGYRDRNRYGGWEREKVLANTDSLISLDTSRSSELPDVRCRAPETAPLLLRADEPLQLRVFLDRSIVEVFVNGRQCVAARVYPGREDSVGVSLRAQGSDAVLNHLNAWQMERIW